MSLAINLTPTNWNRSDSHIIQFMYKRNLWITWLCVFVAVFSSENQSTCSSQSITKGWQLLSGNRISTLSGLDWLETSPCTYSYHNSHLADSLDMNQLVVLPYYRQLRLLFKSQRSWAVGSWQLLVLYGMYQTRRKQTKLDLSVLYAADSSNSHKTRTSCSFCARSTPPRYSNALIFGSNLLLCSFSTSGSTSSPIIAFKKPSWSESCSASTISFITSFRMRL